MNTALRKKVLQRQQQRGKEQLKDQKLAMSRNKALREAAVLERRLKLEQENAVAQARLHKLQAQEAAKKRAKLDKQVRRITKVGAKGVTGIFKAINRLQNSDYAKRFRNEF